MASKRKVIITCAVTGAIHTPSMSKALPVTADEIADAAIGAATAGAAICICTPGIQTLASLHKTQNYFGHFCRRSRPTPMPSSISPPAAALT